MCFSYVGRVNKAITLHEFSSKFAATDLYNDWIFATCRAAGYIFGSRQYWWVWGMSSYSYKSVWGGADSSEPAQQWKWGLSDIRLTGYGVCLTPYKSRAESKSYKENLQGAQWEAPLFTLLQPPATMQLKRRNRMISPRQVFFSPHPLFTRRLCN